MQRCCPCNTSTDHFIQLLPFFRIHPITCQSVRILDNNCHYRYDARSMSKKNYSAFRLQEFFLLHCCAITIVAVVRSDSCVPNWTKMKVRSPHQNTTKQTKTTKTRKHNQTQRDTRTKSTGNLTFPEMKR